MTLVKISGIFLLFLLLTGFSCRSKKKDPVAWLNREPVTVAEFRHWMLLGKAGVCNYFYSKYGIVHSENFWNVPVNGEIPLDMLKEKALSNALRCKAQQLIARRKGIISTIRYDDLMVEMKTINRERERKMARGEPLYGPVSFTSRTYFDLVFDKMVIELKYQLLLNELNPEKREDRGLAKHRKEDAAGFDKLNGLLYVERNYENFIDSYLDSAGIVISFDVIEKIGLED